MEIFNYGEAFSRTIGWVTKSELRTLRSKRIAIAGLGGVGGEVITAPRTLHFDAYLNPLQKLAFWYVKKNACRALYGYLVKEGYGCTRYIANEA